MTSIVNSMSSAWGSFRDWIMGSSAAVGSGTAEAVAIGLTASLMVFAALFLLGLLGQKMTAWTAAGVVAVGLLASVIVQHVSGLVGWLVLGMRFTDVGASLFLVGEVLMVAVMAYNAIMARQLVR